MRARGAEEATTITIIINIINKVIENRRKTSAVFIFFYIKLT